MQIKQQQLGVTLIEMMIGMLVGIVVMGGVATVYVATVESSGETLRGSRLNQELGALLQIMSNDIRRAGFWGDATSGNAVTNPFSAVDASGNFTTALSIRDTSGNSQAGAQGSGDCILFAYDLDRDGNVDTTDTGTNELFGFKQDGDAVDFRSGCSAGGCTAALANSCTAGSWNAVTDTSTIVIENLTFNLSESKCINVSNNNSDCYTTTPSAGDVTSEIREVDITVTGRLATDSTVRSTMTQTVRVRNDMVRER